ncbi:HAT1-interacting factor 1 [Fonsecaea monophora]|uniref:HAT1-interacting factor 1 n=1 Tax=Fonsecaea monophora TaxID=254056 RepID=A0A177EPI9_9EURO|nr:HAT1-interacting factor 1 [Fonsecaea monophora]OAG33904.1 HAT1-interacting factor 1 [Fonsecaea monophora]
MSYTAQEEDTEDRSRQENDGCRSRLTSRNLDRILAKGQSSVDLILTEALKASRVSANPEFTLSRAPVIDHSPMAERSFSPANGTSLTPARGLDEKMMMAVGPAVSVDVSAYDGERKMKAEIDQDLAPPVKDSVALSTLNLVAVRRVLKRMSPVLGAKGAP